MKATNAIVLQNLSLLKNIVISILQYILVKCFSKLHTPPKVVSELLYNVYVSRMPSLLRKFTARSRP